MLKKKILICLTIFICSLDMMLLFMLIKNDQKRLSYHHTSTNSLAPMLDQNASIIIDKTEETEQKNSLHPIIDDYIHKNKLDNKISLSITSLSTHESYTYHENVNFFAASIYKVPLAMLYYEKINNGELSLQDELIYEAYHYEKGGPIADTYAAGTNITLETLLRYAIIYSDNTAAHILFEHLGGWISFKKSIRKYSRSEVDNAFLSGENILTARYMNDVMQYLYQHKEEFEQLLTHMKHQAGSNYLSSCDETETAQKFGRYGAAVNAVGINFCTHPYSIVVFTSMGEEGIKHIGNINSICHDFYCISKQKEVK